MRVLLDTSFLYDLMEAYGEFPDTVRSLLADQDAALYVSAVSLWEMRLKYSAFHRSGDRKSPHNPNEVLAVLQEHNVTFLPLEPRHATRELDTPIPNRDPFDEMLLVQAQEEGLKLLTADRQLAGHPLAITV